MVLDPFLRGSSKGVERINPLWVSFWYSVCTLSVSPLTTTLLTRLEIEVSLPSYVGIVLVISSYKECQVTKF